jgi:hypothetical protein
LFLYRDGHFSRGLLPAPAEGDTLMVLSAFLSKPFLKTQEARQHFPDLKEAYKDGKLNHYRAMKWVSEKIGPMVGDIVFKSTFQDAVHFELHTQNIDALFDSTGELKSEFVRDLFDSLEDPAMLLVEGRDISHLKEFDEFGFVNQLHVKPGDHGIWEGPSLENWYKPFTGQIDAATSFTDDWGVEGRSPFDRIAGQRLLDRFRAMLIQRDVSVYSLKRYPEYDEVLAEGQRPGLRRAAGALRDLWIKYRLDQVTAALPGSAKETRIFQALISSDLVQASNAYTERSLADFRNAIQSAVAWRNGPYARRKPQVEFGEIGGQPFARIRKGGRFDAYFIGVRF